MSQWLDLQVAMRPDSAAMVAEDLLEADSTNADNWAALAISRLEMGDPGSTAETHASAAMAMDSSSSLTLLARGLSMIRYDLAGAEELLARSVALDSTSSLAWAGLARADALDGNLEDAARRFHRALDLRPDFLGAALELAEVMSLSGSGAAADFLGEYLEVSGYDDRVDALLQLGQLRESAGDTARAESVYVAIEDSSTEALKRLGLILERRGSWGAAIKRYRMVLEADSTDLWAHGEMGLCFENVGRYDLAEEWYQKGLALDSSYAWAALRLGLMDFDRGSMSQAAEWLMMATEADPEMIEAWVNLGLALDQLGSFTESEAAYARVVALDPKDAWAWGQLGYAREAIGDLSGAAEAYEEGVGQDSLNTWLWQQRGLLYEDAGEYDSAISWFRMGVERSAPSAWMLGELGSLLTRRGDRDSALACFSASLELDSCYLFGRMNLARILEARGRTVEALDEMETYLACGGDSSIALASMAILLREAGMAGRADSLESIIETSRPDAWVTLAWSHYYSYMEESSAKLADSAFARGVSGVEGLLSLADLYGQLGLPGRADEVFHRAVEMEPEATLPWMAWGSSLYQRGRYDLAAERYQTALAIDSSSSETWAYLGEALIFEGDLPQARRALERAVELDPGSVFAICYLGLVEERSGKPSAALEHYLAALRISPGYGYAESRIASISDPSYDAGWWRLSSRPVTARVWLDLSAESGNIEERDYRGGVSLELKLDGNGSSLQLEGSGTLEEEDSEETRNTAWAAASASYFLTDGIYVEASSTWDRQPLTVRPWQVSSYAALGYKRWISDWAWVAPELGAGVVNSRWSWGAERTDELSSYASLGIWLEKEGSLLPSLWLGAGLYSTPGEPDDLLSDGNAELTFEAWRRISVSLGWSYDYTRTPVVPIWEKLDTETYLRLNLDIL